jgi:hypothetical protein
LVLLRPERRDLVAEWDSMEALDSWLPSNVCRPTTASKAARKGPRTSLEEFGLSS